MGCSPGAPPIGETLRIQEAAVPLPGIAEAPKSTVLIIFDELLVALQELYDHLQRILRQMFHIQYGKRNHWICKND